MITDVIQTQGGVLLSNRSTASRLANLALRLAPLFTLLSLAYLQFLPGHDATSRFSQRAVKTKGWPFVSVVEIQIPSGVFLVGREEAYPVASVSNWLVVAVLVVSVSIVYRRLLRGKIEAIQFGFSHLLWYSFFFAIFTKFCVNEAEYYEWLNNKLYGTQKPVYYFEHWGETRPAWNYLIAIWIGFFAMLECFRFSSSETLTRLRVWITKR